ncbi:MAG: 50S ribosomal protein L23 [Clostridia bacterium]|nr:50S ribosomal protein L23 [Clostridia bacterium]MBQ3076948.1 50S ribosomal protein L23 [Clostridia bacterium]
MKSPYDIIRKPVITERSLQGAVNKIYTFEVALGSNKHEIANAVEEIFKVKVESVNTMNLRGKQKRMGVHLGTTSRRKKAIVKLTEDSKPIEFFEGMM